MENWKRGIQDSVVVTDTANGFPSYCTGHIGHDSVEYYGGNLICESIARKEDVALISAAPDMLEALQNLENDDGSIPDNIWEMVKKAIYKATTIV